jgi:hypothetical protein
MNERGAATAPILASILDSFLRLADFAAVSPWLNQGLWLTTGRC